MVKVLLLLLLTVFPLEEQMRAQSDSLIIELIDDQIFVPIKPIEIIYSSDPSASDTLIFLYKGELLSVSIDDISKIIVAKKSKFWKYLATGAGIGIVAGAIPGIIILGKISSENSQSSSRYIDLSGLAYAIGFAILFAGAGIGLIAGATIGGITGAIVSKNIVYDFSKMTGSEKIETIQKLIKKYKER
ncbi:hypothetical protein JGI1_00453 [Candidatus Thermokryptus mobilis]|uniref:Uncharacterized protein n=1 Tax=Candidatus Thermokryptus mobilis TaxID=1643428 RepID=A0A0S4MU92_9BACT|nr:hypothetical protein [Candidatus Thermokryptus mobilis]CUU02297.1 hypothetical protein JGI1_00453 [Candidatus Thermokryptus mobilis]